MKINKKILLALIFFLLCIHAGHLSVEAETTAFTVLPSIPENQVSDATYFDLLVKEETKETLTMIVQNTSDQTLEIEGSAVNSYTTSTGIIAYQKTETAEKNQGHSFTRFIEPKQQKIKLKPSEAKEVLFTLDLKKQKLVGEVLGAFSFDVVSEDTKESKNDTMIQARYVTQVGVRLRSDLTELPSPNLSLEKTEPVVKNDKAVIESTIKNDQPTAFGGVKVQTTIYAKKNNKIVGEKKIENYQIAPNSTIPLITELVSKQLEPGDYTTHIEVTSSKGQWSFDDSFTISKEEAKSMNQKTVYAQDDNKNLLVFLLISFILVLLVIILWSTWKYHQLKKSQSE